MCKKGYKILLGLGLITMLSNQANAALFGMEAEIGAGVISTSSVYKDMDGSTDLFPLISVSNDYFYFDGEQLAVYLPGTENFSSNVYINSNTVGYDGDSDTYMSGMYREDMLAAGIEVDYTTEYHTSFMLDISGDIEEESNGYTINAGVGQVIPVAENWYAYVQAAGIFRDKSYSDYYYGVHKTEATANRAEYKLDSTLSCNLDASLVYSAYDYDISAFTSYEIYDVNIANSPIVDNDRNFSGGLTFTCYFE